MSDPSGVRILIVDDDPRQARALSESLRAFGYETAAVDTGAAALDVMRQDPHDILLSDLVMPGMGGVELLLEATKIDPHLVGILMTGSGTIETAVTAMKAGALDYILKPVDLKTVLPVLSRAASVRRLRLENLQLRDTVAIHELSQAIAYTLDQKELLDRIVDAALAQFEGDEASIMLLSPDGAELVIASVRGDGRERLLGRRIPVGMGIAGWVARHGEPMQMHGETVDPRANPLYPRRDIRSALCLPMVTRGTLVGVLNVNCTRQRRSFPVGQINVVSIFTNAAAASLRTASLLEQERKADARYREVLTMVQEGVVSIDESHRIVVFNRGASHIFGWPADAVVGQPIDLLWATDVESVRGQGLHRAVRDGPSALQDRDRVLGRRADGSFIQLEVSFSTSAVAGEMLTTAVMRDVTRLVAQEQKLARLTRLYAVLSGVSSAIVRLSDVQALFAEVCRIAHEEGRLRAAWVGRFDREAGALEPLAAAGDTARIEADGISASTRTGQLLARAVREARLVWENEEADAATSPPGGSATAVLPFVVDGEVEAFMVLVADSPDAFGDRELLLLRDLTGDIAYALDHISKAAELSYIATHDQLTGLPNRAVFLDRLSLALATRHGTNASLAVVVADLERFGQVNSTFGREAGDEMLRQVADRFRSVAGDMYSLARLGADTFAAIQTGHATVPEIAKEVGDRLELALASPFAVRGQKVYLTGRAGIATYPNDGNEAETLLLHAEAALARAKSQQQRLVLYTPDLNTAVKKQLAMEGRLRRALDRGELVLHFQPKIELASGRISGAEALLRWNDAETGLVPPLEFIPMLEQSGLILPVGRWVMAEAIRASQMLRENGLPPVRMAVNVSPVQLRHEGFVASVEAAVKAANGSPHGLDIEVTEGVVMEDIDTNIEKLRQLRGLGVGVAIDDFGSGYSSLAYLARLPADVIKIDRTFVHTMAHDPDHTSIVSTVISLAHSLNRLVVAEGVEDMEQARLLRLLRCDHVQGYLYGRPVPFAEFERLVRRGIANGAADASGRLS
ncbi:MAG: EAL domain-containing protein [Gemmatimonadaceae bacterium]|nr:EAL domain-containing protein [Gemmatimonadaceae bacterium]